MFDSSVLFNSAVRVPSVIPGLWVYLRKWHKHQYLYERTHQSSILCVVANHGGGALTVDGLQQVIFTHRGSLELNVVAIDAYLLSIGAEPVGVGEWPEYCVGIGLREEDRKPLRDESDLDKASEIVRTLGVLHV